MRPLHKLFLILGAPTGLWVGVLFLIWSDVPSASRPPPPPSTAPVALAAPSAIAPAPRAARPAPARFDPAAGAAFIAGNDCVACHKPDSRLVGPSYREIADRYRDDPAAPARLVEKVRAGGAGSWGQIPMAPHPTLTKQQLGDMVAWILAQQTPASASGVAAAPAPPVAIPRPVMGALQFADPLKIPAPVTPAHAVAPLAPLPAPTRIDAAKADLGRRLFFDPRLSGDATIACATCHDPDQGFGDGQPLSAGYPGSLHFRNSPTLLNATLQTRFLWDGRLDGADPATLVRDMITEAHTMNLDGRLMQERLKQVPEYLAAWRAIFGPASDPYGPQVFSLIAEFLKTLRAADTPFDRHLAGATDALDARALRGLDLFQGKAGCIQCHDGPLLSDGGFHVTGVPEHPDLAREPLRAITRLRHYATFGVPNYMSRRTDLGLYTVTKDARDLGKFRTAPLRELTRTAPYMHNGALATLEAVIAFYDRGGGDGPGKDPRLRPLGLTPAEQDDLLAFLRSLSGAPVTVERPAAPPDYQLREFGEN